MRVPAILFATEELVRGMDEKVYEQIANVAALTGIQKAAYAMPDASYRLAESDSIFPAACARS